MLKYFDSGDARLLWHCQLVSPDRSALPFAFLGTISISEELCHWTSYVCFLITVLKMVELADSCFPRLYPHRLKTSSKIFSPIWFYPFRFQRMNCGKPLIPKSVSWFFTIWNNPVEVFIFLYSNFYPYFRLLGNYQNLINEFLMFDRLFWPLVSINILI